MHQTVLLQEAVEALAIRSGGTYIDGTFGRGGHSRKILESLGEHGKLFVFDKDPDAISEARSLAAGDKRVSAIHASFSEIKTYMSELGLLEKVDGVLLDLGLSSPQVDQAARGFSFKHDGPLDMRMDNSEGVSAAQWLASVNEQELVEVIRTYGEERFAKRIARRIVNTRKEKAIETTGQLAAIVSQAIPKWEKHKHPATRSFQAIRIFINRELKDLEDLLNQVLEVLKVSGRLVVISFHSLEDRLVKQWIARMERGDEVPAYIPVTEEQLNKKLCKVGKAIKPTEDEILANPRARSAVMRIAEKL